MKIEIDQSGKIEDTHHDTIIAYTNGQTKSLKIPSGTKRDIQKLFRKIGEPRSYVIHTFTTLIYLLIADELDELTDVVIDIEYPGFESVISRLLTIICQGEKGIVPDIYFKLVGKRSKAHKTALKVFRGKSKSDQEISLNQLRKSMFRLKNKEGRPVLKYRSP